MVAINMPDDAPFASNVNRNAPGLITFLDSPGTGKYGFPLVAGNFTYTFNTAFTAPSGSGCSINWSLTFYFSSGGFSITSRIN